MLNSPVTSRVRRLIAPLPLRVTAITCALLCTTALSAQTVTPKFAWGVNAIADITGSSDMVFLRDGQRDSTGREQTSRVELRAHPDGFVVISGPSSGFSMPVASSSMGVSLDAMSRIVSRFVINANGKYVRVDSIDALKQSMDSVMAPIYQQMAGASPAMADAIRSGTSVESIERSSARGWMQMAGFIYGHSWSPGESVQDTSSQPLPGLPGADMITVQTSRFVGAVACPGASGARNCWRFETRSEIDLASMRRGLARVMTQMGMSDPSMIDRIPIPRTTSTAYYIFDSATSRPLEVATVTESTTGATMGEGGGVNMGVVGHVLLHYNWRNQ